MNTPAEKVDHARANAAAWAGSIAEMVAAMNCDYDRLEELRDTKESDPEVQMDATEAEELAELEAAATIDGDKMENADAARERIQESPLSVEVREDWHAAGDTGADPAEFCILLSAGGPALRIRGDLDGCQPTRAWLEYQDWGTGWTEYHGDGCEASTLLEFCTVFYFGE